MSPSITSNTPSTTNTTNTSSSSSASQANSNSDPLANESTFLTLLVSQLQNQDPTSPVDSNEFVTQLTGYAQLEQLIGINQNTTTLADPSTTSTSTSTSTPGTSGGN